MAPQKPLVFDSGITQNLPTGDRLDLGAFTLPETDGAANQVLQTNGSGTVSWATVSGGGGGAPASPTNSVQFNNAGAFGGSAGLTWNGSTLAVNGAVDRATAGTLTVGGTTATSVTVGSATANTVSLTAGTSVNASPRLNVNALDRETAGTLYIGLDTATALELSTPTAVTELNAAAFEVRGVSSEILKVNTLSSRVLINGTGATATPAALLDVRGGDARINGITVGSGPGSLSTNTVLGSGAGGAVSLTGTNLTCIGSSSSPSATSATNEATLGNGVVTFRFNNPSNTAPNGGLTATTLTTRPAWNIGHITPNSANAPFVTFLINGTIVGGIRQAAAGGTPLVYATSSDYRIKTDVQPIDDPLGRLAALNPCRFHFTTNPSGPLVEGFIAHEVQGIVPQAVVGTKDEVDAEGNQVHQGIDQAHLVPLLTAACKALAAKADAAEARLAALEAAVASLQSR